MSRVRLKVSQSLASSYTNVLAHVLIRSGSMGALLESEWFPYNII